VYVDHYNEWGDPIVKEGLYIHVVHWGGLQTADPDANPPVPGCGCHCDDSACHPYYVCKELTNLPIDDPDHYLTGIGTTPSEDCYNLHWNNDDPDNQFWECILGTGANLPDRYSACYVPMMELLSTYCGFNFRVESGTSRDCEGSVNIFRVS
jgi:hypothetical protein